MAGTLEQGQRGLQPNFADQRRQRGARSFEAAAQSRRAGAEMSGQRDDRPIGLRMLRDETADPLLPSLALNGLEPVPPLGEQQQNLHQSMPPQRHRHRSRVQEGGRTLYRLLQFLVHRKMRGRRRVDGLSRERGLQLTDEIVGKGQHQRLVARGACGVVDDVPLRAARHQQTLATPSLQGVRRGDQGLAPLTDNDQQILPDRQGPDATACRDGYTGAIARLGVGARRPVRQRQEGHDGCTGPRRTRGHWRSVQVNRPLRS